MNAVAVAPVNGAGSHEQYDAENPAGHRSGRGGYRAGSGRPRMQPEDKRVRMSVGFTGANLRWLREKSAATDQPIARILNDLVTNEVARERAESDTETIAAAIDSMI